MKYDKVAACEFIAITESFNRGNMIGTETNRYGIPIRKCPYCQVTVGPNRSTRLDRLYFPCDCTEHWYLVVTGIGDQKTFSVLKFVKADH